MQQNEKEIFMYEALKLANKAYKNGEVPIGAIIVRNGKVLAKAFNKREKNNCAVDHAEILAIKKACKKLNSWRLNDCELFVTLEPCVMCAGAIFNARIKKVYFGASDNKKNFFPTAQIFDKNNLNHKLEFESGILENECSEILKSFFKEKRRTNRI